MTTINFKGKVAFVAVYSLVFVGKQGKRGKINQVKLCLKIKIFQVESYIMSREGLFYGIIIFFDEQTFC